MPTLACDQPAHRLEIADLDAQLQPPMRAIRRLHQEGMDRARLRQADMIEIQRLLETRPRERWPSAWPRAQTRMSRSSR